jgi:hypothetical protein
MPVSPGLAAEAQHNMTTKAATAFFFMTHLLPEFDGS